MASPNVIKNQYYHSLGFHLAVKRAAEPNKCSRQKAGSGRKLRFLFVGLASDVLAPKLIYQMNEFCLPLIVGSTCRLEWSCARKLDSGA